MISMNSRNLDVIIAPQKGSAQRNQEEYWIVERLTSPKIIVFILSCFEIIREQDGFKRHCFKCHNTLYIFYRTLVKIKC